MNVIETIRELFAQRGNSQYGHEAVSQLEHALQAAALAEADRASDALITASLLHDVGHLLHDLPDDAPDRGIDDRHEELAAVWLMDHFGEAVSEPARLHVAAKRYLCATSGQLPEASEPAVATEPAAAGGPMSSDEVAAFRAHPWSNDAVRLRIWDDQAKVSDLRTPDLEHFLKYAQRCLPTGDDPAPTTTDPAQ